MASKRKKSGLLRRPNTITGTKTTPKSLKPQQSRQLIRRFHILNKNKSSIINKLNNLLKLGEDDQKITLDKYIPRFKLDYPQLYKSYEQKYKSFKMSVKHADNSLIKIDANLTKDELINKLGEIDAEIDQRGGIEAYQSASTQGQNAKRGGDSSRKLVEWLRDSQYHYKDKLNQELNALEIGCLSANNLISTCGVFKEVVKIDLNSQGPSILQQNFMERPLPKSNNEKFNLISCSLVINFVPSPIERGEMLKRITSFLKSPKNSSISSLFLVLPLPCISNSRYFDSKTLNEVMESLGFKQICYYESSKVAYWLFDWKGKSSMQHKRFTKKQLYQGSNRNNFCIMVD